MPTNGERRKPRGAGCLRLKGLPEQPPLKRGVWYPLTDFDTRSDLVTLDVDGEERTLAYSFLKARRDKPERATVFSPSTLSTPKMGFDVMTYVAVCPKGHEMGEVNPVEPVPLACADCGGREWEWDFE